MMIVETWASLRSSGSLISRRNDNMRRRILATFTAAFLLGVVLLPLIPAVQGRARQLWYRMTLPSVVPVFSNGQYQGSYIGGKWRSYRQELESLPVPIHERFDQTVKELEAKAHSDCQGHSYDLCVSDENKELAAVKAMKELDCGVLEQKKR
jgi:hypothetical protein